MANAVTALDKGKPRAEPLMVAIAAVAAGMFVGTWVLGPMISSGPMSKEHGATEPPLTYEQMVAQPDPFPYRTPTPVVEQPAQTNYGAIAKQRAQAEYGGAYTEDAPADDPWQSRRGRWRLPDRHAVH